MTSENKLYSRYSTYIKPLTKNPLVKTYGTKIFTLLVMSVFIFYAIKPTVETILVLQKKLEDSNQVLKQVKEKTSNLAKAQQNYENLDQIIKDKIEGSIPDTASLKSVIENLELTAKKYDASISALQIQPLNLKSEKDAVVGSISDIEFTFNVEGEYQTLISILQDLKSSDRLLTINNISLSKLSEGTGLIMSLSGKAYYLK